MPDVQKPPVSGLPEDLTWYPLSIPQAFTDWDAKTVLLVKHEYAGAVDLFVIGDTVGKGEVTVPVMKVDDYVIDLPEMSAGKYASFEINPEYYLITGIVAANSTDANKADIYVAGMRVPFEPIKMQQAGGWRVVFRQGNLALE